MVTHAAAPMQRLRSITILEIRCGKGVEEVEDIEAVEVQRK
jgi:hypothetical protein